MKSTIETAGNTSLQYQFNKRVKKKLRYTKSLGVIFEKDRTNLMSLLNSCISGAVKTTPDFEELLSFNAPLACYYLSGFKEPLDKDLLEGIVAKDPKTSLKYAKLLGGRFIKGEPTILKSSKFKYAYTEFLGTLIQ